MQKARSIFLAVLAVGITFYAVWSQNRPLVVKPSTQQDVLAEAEKGGYDLIDTGKLWELYQKNLDTVLIVDTRQEWEYRTGSIKGAMNFPMEPSWWSRWRKKEAMAKLLGPDKKRTIVFY